MLDDGDVILPKGGGCGGVNIFTVKCSIDVDTHTHTHTHTHTEREREQCGSNMHMTCI